MANHKRKVRVPKPHGSTVILLVMYLTVVWYTFLQIWFYSTFQAFLPSELTLLFGACFVAETVSLVKYKLRKEASEKTGKPFELPAKAANPFLEGIGLFGLDDFESEGRDTNQTQGGQNGCG